MNFYLNKLPVAAVSRQFGANWSAFWCKTECVLPLNGVRFGAKRKVFWCKMECVLMLNARQNGAKHKTF